jgi:hypothetical protein
MTPPEPGPAAVPRPVYRMYHKVGSVLLPALASLSG